MYRELQAGNWTMIGTTTTTNYTDTFPLGTPLVRYKIKLADTVVNGGVPAVCYSVSNVVELNYISAPTQDGGDLFNIGNPVPNPASVKVYIPLKVVADGNLLIVVTDITGKIHGKYNSPVVKGSSNIELDVISWSPGLYFFTIYYKDMKQTGRLVVIH